GPRPSRSSTPLAAFAPLPVAAVAPVADAASCGCMADSQARAAPRPSSVATAASAAAPATHSATTSPQRALLSMPTSGIVDTPQKVDDRSARLPGPSPKPLRRPRGACAPGDRETPATPPQPPLPDCASLCPAPALYASRGGAQAAVAGRVSGSARILVPGSAAAMQQQPGAHRPQRCRSPAGEDVGRVMHA